MNLLNLLTLIILAVFSSTSFANTESAPTFKSIKANDSILSALQGGTSGVGGGGDEVGLEFQQTFLKAIDKIKKNWPEVASAVEIEKLEQIPKGIEVFVVENVLKVPVKGLTQNSVAYNNRKLGVILINRTRWEKIKQIELKEAVAIHEVASLAGLERTGYYPISAKYAALAGVSPSSFTSLVDADKTQKISITDDVCQIRADGDRIAVFIGKKRVTEYGINYEYYVAELNKFRYSHMCTVVKESCKMTTLQNDWYVLVNSAGQRISEQASNTDYLINIFNLYRAAGLCQ